MAGTEHPFPGDQGELGHLDRHRVLPGGLVGGGQVVPCVQDLGMITAQQPLEVRGQLLAERDGPRADSTAMIASTRELTPV